jgi:DNA polymerase-3 subunit delta'
MLAELDRHPHASAVLAPVLAPGGIASHAYLFYGPGGSGKRAAARAIAAELLSAGAPDPAGARSRVMSGAHPDLSWIAPSGAHEILVSDIDEPVVAAASKTPFESSRRVFVIERVDELGDEAANRMLKTLEEPPDFVHLILLTDRLTEVLPTISSRCQLVRFDAPSFEEVAAELHELGVTSDHAQACARLSLGDLEQARMLAGRDGQALRASGERFAAAALAGEASASKPWLEMLASVRAKGEALQGELEAERDRELEFVPRKEQKRVTTEWTERIRRGRRRAETRALDLALQVASLWYADLAALAWGTAELVRNGDRLEALQAARSVDPRRLLTAVDLVEQTRRRFVLNVSEELACEALALRLEQVLGADSAA